VEEGVIRFDLRYTKTAPVPAYLLSELNAWRRILWQLGLIGQDPARYGGYGFGNVSVRIAAPEAPAGECRFLVSGTQTAALEVLEPVHYCVVNAYDPESNRVIAGGPVKPSSESLTHAMIYDQDARIQSILHVHSTDIWGRAGDLGIAATATDVAYGTPDMAHEVQRLFRESEVSRTGIFAMGGHKDGIVTFGETPGAAGNILLTALAHSYTS